MTTWLTRIPIRVRITAPFAAVMTILLVRLLAVPAGTNILVVGASLSDRSDALRRLGEVFVIGGPVAIAAAWLASWAVAGWALHPVERMRRQASAITVSGLDRRLTVPQ